MNTEPDDRISTARPSGKGPGGTIIAVVALAVVALVGWWLFSDGESDSAPQPVEIVTEPVQAPAPVPAAVEPEPILEPELEVPAEPPPPPLPTLAESDIEVRAVLGDTLAPEFSASLKNDQLIPRGSVLLHNLASGKVLRDKLALPTIPGKFKTSKEQEQVVISPENYARYDSTVTAITRTDPAAVAAFINRFEPLINEAYQQIDNNSANARDDIMATLNTLLNTEYPDSEPELVQPSVFFKYKDPELEALPDNAKILIRMGPENRERLIDWMRELRSELRE